MVLVKNDELYKKIESLQYKTNSFMHENMIKEPFENDFAVRFCWSSNSLEGNTLSLDETVSVIEYDEVRSGHSYSEYWEAKQLYKAIRAMLVPVTKNNITEDWIKQCNAVVMDSDGSYRKDSVYIGTLVEAVYYPPSYERIPELMSEFVLHVNIDEANVTETIQKIAKLHMDFERIHPFHDGNGRVGRMILNQQLINNGLLPIAIEKRSDYRQAFRRYDKNGDISIMEHIICKGQIEALERLQNLGDLWMEQTGSSKKNYLEKCCKEHSGAVKDGPKIDIGLY